MGAPAKFLFDIDFAAADSARERTASAADIAAQVTDAEARGYRQGFEAAQREAKTDAERRTVQALEQIGAAMAAIAERFAAVEGRMETEAIEVALAVARKLCAGLMAAEPLAETMALVEDCFRHLTSTPHLAVRIHDSLYDAARERIEQLARRCGFEGRLVILADPDIAAGDCRIEWADGGVTLDRAATEAKIDELVGRYLASRDQAGPRP